MVEVKTRIDWVAYLVSNRGTKTRVHSSLPGAGGDPTGHQPYCQKSRRQGHGQVNAQQVPVPFVLFSCFHPSPSHGFFFFAVSGVNSVNGSRSQPPSPSKTHLICLVECLILPLNISTLRLCTDDILGAVYTSVHDNVVKGTKTNIFVAAFTTCHARLKLYESLDTLQEQVLYYETDSVVYKWCPDQRSIDTGYFLGDMTYELDGDVITEFVSGGAKNYGYTTRQGKVVCKVRGFTLNVRGAAVLNFQTIKDNILELEKPTGPSPHHQCGDVLLFSKRFRTKTYQSGSTHKTIWLSL